PAAPAPDAIFYGGAGYTRVGGAPTAGAGAGKGGKGLAGGTAGALGETGEAPTRPFELKGAFLCPRVPHTHTHPSRLSQREHTPDLDEIASVAQLAQVVGDAAKAAPAGQTLRGRGWIETHWPEKRFPTRQDIDAVTGDRPTILTRADGHALLANTAALKAAG